MSTKGEQLCNVEVCYIFILGASQEGFSIKLWQISRRCPKSASKLKSKSKCGDFFSFFLIEGFFFWNLRIRNQKHIFNIFQKKIEIFWGKEKKIHICTKNFTKKRLLWRTHVGSYFSKDRNLWLYPIHIILIQTITNTSVGCLNGTSTDHTLEKVFATLFLNSMFFCKRKV
jgi:hypothetical protein